MLLFFLSLAAIFMAAACTERQKSVMRVDTLRCEYLENPLGIDETRPRLSWILLSARRSAAQTAYRILVASSREKLARNEGDLWDTGRVQGDQTAQVIYRGKELTSGRECFWKVCAWDQDGLQTEFSEPAAWSMGLLSADDWKAEWIGMESLSAQSPVSAEEDMPPGPPPAWIRKEFSLSRPVKKALVYASARGIFGLHLNGNPVTSDLFAPEWTDYGKRIQYHTFDVTSLLTQGPNAVGIVLADGWYSGYLSWMKRRNNYGGRNSVLMQIEIEYQDGARDIIATDKSWRCKEGPVLYADFLLGESYDARREMPGWDTPGYDQSGWQTAAVMEKPDVPLVAQPSEPVRVTERIEPVEVFQPRPGVYVFDLGQNIAGWARLRVQGDPGTKVTLRFAERLNPDSTIYTANLRTAKATDTYILKGGGEEIYEPRFTFHGFQYVELTGFPGVPGRDAITGCVVHSTAPPAGTFECSDPLVNQLWRNIYWGQRGNFISVPTDCPQRDERLGWMGDAQIFIRTATCNMNVAAFFTKWMRDVEDAQSAEGAFSEVSPRFSALTVNFGSAGWGDAGIIVPWTIYQVYGDTRIIEKHYDAMTRWMNYILEANPDLIRRNKLGNNYGDWLSIGENTPKDLLATAYWAYDAKLMSKMAGAISRQEDQRKYAELFEGIRAAFQKNYVSENGLVLGDTQTGYLLALYLDLLPEDSRRTAFEHLMDNLRRKDWHLSTGFLGVRQLNLVLTDMGRTDTAYRLLHNETFPSWLYPIKNGATTIWERWDGWTREKGFQDPGMNSFNHYSLGSVGEWLFCRAAGIDLDPENPGFKSIVIHPHPGGKLKFARAEYESIRGRIASGWSRDGDTLTLDIAVPVNTTAKVYFPCPENSTVTESGVEAASAEGVTTLGREDNSSVFEVKSGDYHFKGVTDL